MFFVLKLLKEYAGGRAQVDEPDQPGEPRPQPRLQAGRYGGQERRLRGHARVQEVAQHEGQSTSVHRIVMSNRGH